MWKGWGAGVCEWCSCIVYEGDGCWTEYEKIIYHTTCYWIAKKNNKLVVPMVKREQTPKAPKK